MTNLRNWGALAMGVAIPFGAVGSAGLAPAPLGRFVQAALEQLAHPGPRRAEIAVVFGPDGKVVSGALVRSTGRSASDAAALDGALQLAALEPRGAVAGRTLVFGAEFEAAMD